MVDSSAPVRTRRRVSLDLWVWLGVGYTLVIFLLGSLPSAPGPRNVSDKLEHAVGFGLLAWVWCHALVRLRPRWSSRSVVIGAFLVSVALGGALELWQLFLRYRSCELLDWVADGLGAALGVGTYAVLGALFGARRQSPAR